MDLFAQLISGFAVALQPVNLFYCFVGCLIGTLVGVLPGLGPTAAMALLLPATFHVTPVTAVIMLSGIYYGAMYGGSTTSILVNIPGEAASVMTCLDGYQMARQGRAGAALGMSAFASFIAGTLGILGLTLMAPPLASFALKFGPPEYFALMCMGMVVLSFLTGTSMIRSLMMACAGIIAGTVGTDTVSGSTRFTFGITELMDGIGLVPLVMGLFGISEIILNLEQNIDREVFKAKVSGLMPTVADWAASKWALLLGALILHGVTPGPLLLTKNPDIFWGVVASMYIGNVMLLVLNLPLIGMWVQLLRIPYPFLMPAIVIFCIVGSYTVTNSVTDVYLMLAFGVFGYLMKKLKFDAPPLVLAFVLGPLIEYYFKSALMYSRGSFAVFVTRPISLACLAVAAIVLVWSLVAAVRRSPSLFPKEEP
jgi:TctA family transporter